MADNSKETKVPEEPMEFDKSVHKGVRRGEVGLLVDGMNKPTSMLSKLDQALACY